MFWSKIKTRTVAGKLSGVEMELKLADFPASMAGLQYIREDGVVCPRVADEQWLVSLMDDGKVAVSRYCNGLLNESYAYMLPNRRYVQCGEIALVPKHAIYDMPAESHKIEQGYYDGHISGFGGTVDAR